VAAIEGAGPCSDEGGADAPKTPILPREIRRLRVAVRTQQRKVLEAVVASVAVDVV
jgi:hypothetical protein